MKIVRLGVIEKNERILDVLYFIFWTHIREFMKYWFFYFLDSVSIHVCTGKAAFLFVSVCTPNFILWPQNDRLFAGRVQKNNNVLRKTIIFNEYTVPTYLAWTDGHSDRREGGGRCRCRGCRGWTNVKLKAAQSGSHQTSLGMNGKRIIIINVHMYMYMVDKADTTKAKEIHKCFYFHDKKIKGLRWNFIHTYYIFNFS